MEEAEKYGHMRLKQEEEKRIAAGGDPDEKPDYKLKTLEEENSKLKRLLADAMLDNAALKDLATKNF